MAYLLAKDTVNGASGKVIVTVNGRNIEVACMRNITTNAEIQSSDMRVIGTKKIQDKQNGAKLTGTGNIYYGTNLWTDMVLDYINNGITTEFDVDPVRPAPELQRPGPAGERRVRSGEKPDVRAGGPGARPHKKGGEEHG